MRGTFNKSQVMKFTVLLARIFITLSLFASCAGIERVNARRQTDSQLKLRLTQVERELTTLRFGQGALRDVILLESERDAIERELLSRYEKGDRDAYLPQFR